MIHFAVQRIPHIVNLPVLQSLAWAFIANYDFVAKDATRDVLRGEEMQTEREEMTFDVRYERRDESPSQRSATPAFDELRLSKYVGGRCTGLLRSPFRLS